MRLPGLVPDDSVKSQTRKITSLDSVYEEGLRKLKTAPNDSVKGYAYGMLGDVSFKKQQYKKSIKYLEKAAYYSQKAGDYEGYFIVNFLMVNTYREVGLISKMNEKLNVLKRLNEKWENPMFQQLLNQCTLLLLEEERRFYEAIPYRKEIIDYSKEKYEENLDPHFKTFWFNSISHLCYNQIKINSITDARKNLAVSDSLISTGKLNEEDMFYGIHYLNKAILAVLDKNEGEALHWFNLAESEVKKKGSKRYLLRIYENRLASKLSYDRLSNDSTLEKYLELKDAILKQSGEVLNQESVSFNNILSRKTSLLNGLFIVLFFLISVIILLVFLNKRKRKSQLQEFKKVLQPFENKKVISEEKTIPDTLSSQKSPISLEKEEELLKLLEDFEKGSAYADKNFTLSNLVSILNTNTKYANYIIKKYRGEKTFNEYLNSIKIKFILDRLINKPEYLNYKIQYLAEISGFSTHSRFTEIFKKEVGMSPSDFISHLAKK